MSNTLTWPCVNVLGRVNVCVNTKIICKVTLSLGLLSPPNPSFRGTHKSKEMLLNLGTKCWFCTRFKIHYSSFTSRSSESICSDSGGAKGKRKDRVKLSSPQKLRIPTLEWMLIFYLFLNLTLFMIKLRVLVLFSLLYR